MTQSFGFGWVTTLLLFVGFCAGGYYIYDTTQKRTAQRRFESCIQNATLTASTTSARGHRNQVDFCHDLYNQDSPYKVSGLFGAKSNGRIYLAMIHRPNFRQ